MKKTFLSFALLATSLVALAASALHPYQEVNYRTNGNDPTSWTFLKVADGTNVQFEVKWSARIFAVQQWAIPNISKAQEINIFYTRVAGQSNDATVAMWPFPYEVLTTNTFSLEEGSFLDNVKTIWGVYPGGDHELMNAPLATAVAGADSANNFARVLTFDATAITVLKSSGKVSNDTLYVNMLLSTMRKDNDLNYKYYSIGSSEKVNYMIVTEPQSSYPVDNKNTGVGYSTLATAVAAAAENDTLIVNEDVTISGNRLENNVTVTIIGKTGNEKILRDKGLDNIMFLPKKAITLKDIILDGQSVNRKKPVFEVSNAAVTLTLDNVTVQNFSRTDSDQKQGHICLKTNGTVVLRNTTFLDNAVAEGYGDVFVGVNKKVILDGNNIIPNGIYLEKSFAVIDSTATHTTPIDLIVEGTRTIGEATDLVYGTTDVTKYSLIATNPDWVIAAGAKSLYIKDAATALPETTAKTAKAVKVICNGQLMIQKGDMRFDVLGTQLK